MASNGLGPFKVGEASQPRAPPGSQRPETPESGSDSGSLSPASTTSTGSELEEVPDDLDLSKSDGKGKFPQQKGSRVGGRGSRSGGRTRQKGQKFQCIGYGSCNLSFTRSEHLSRHIRLVSKLQAWTRMILTPSLGNILERNLTLAFVRETFLDWTI